jgi:predicted transcriptional regulator
MDDDLDADTAGALEDIAYLARSQNRFRILDALASESYTPRELTEKSDIARTTVGRIVNEFEKRGWVERAIEGEYTATPTGEQVVVEFTPLVDSMVAIRNLGETVAWLQAIEPTVDLHQLRDATVWKPESGDLMAPTMIYLNDLREATEFYCSVGIAPPVPFEKAMRDGVVERQMRVDHVISESEYSYLRGYPERMERWREYINGGANVYRYDGDVQCNLFILDETLYIANSQSEYGEPYTVIQTDNEQVRSWAHEIIRTHKTSAERLDAEAFTE